ncbi:MAG: zinc-dependent peptidase [Bacteroidota bacterium]|nr:zinc-dependent peptidase [Bacteroidota bacterium]
MAAVAYAAAGEVTDETFFFYLFIVAMLSGYIFYRLSRKHWVKKAAVRKPFPPEWEQVLQEKIAFFHSLNGEGQKRFRREIQEFIACKRISGVKTAITEEDKVLVAASAIIPIFGFPDWEYHNLAEVLLYPGSFRHDYSVEGKKDRNIQGMVGSGGYMNGMMILSLPDLRRGFENITDKQNVGIHEFVHLIDKDDGAIDGLPATLIGKEYMIPWLEEMHEEMQDIKKGRSDFNPYGAFNKQEFLAVASEYFFERPGLMAEKHPDLYKVLRSIFRQDTATRFKKLVGEFNPIKPKKAFGRNSPCPCGSGEKFKVCCGVE